MRVHLRRRSDSSRTNTSTVQESTAINQDTRPSLCWIILTISLQSIMAPDPTSPHASVFSIGLRTSNQPPPSSPPSSPPPSSPPPPLSPPVPASTHLAPLFPPPSPPARAVWARFYGRRPVGCVQPPPPQAPLPPPVAPPRRVPRPHPAGQQPARHAVRDLRQRVRA